jgi:hypothetical protein
MIESRTFWFGRFVLVLARDTVGWTVSLNGARLDVWFYSEADAWNAGVTEADRLNRMWGGLVA